MIDLYCGDNRVVLRHLIDTGVRVHSCVTDPPYNLDSITKRFGKMDAAPARAGSDGRFSRASKNFIGTSWDVTGIERDPEFWRLVHEILLPGGFVFAFAGARTGHWVGCALETAGFIVHPMHAWLYATGFPKGHSAEAAGPEWAGWYHGTQTQKPAMEPIFLAQKPIESRTTVENVRTFGVGALNVDSCRTENDARYWPANVLHDGSEIVCASLNRDSEVDKFFVCAKPSKEERAGTKHPTVKPIKLLRHLIRHVTPKGGTVLDPFAGSGSTGIAASLDDVHCLLIEVESAYVAEMERRLHLRAEIVDQGVLDLI